MLEILPLNSNKYWLCFVYFLFTISCMNRLLHTYAVHNISGFSINNILQQIARFGIIHWLIEFEAPFNRIYAWMSWAIYFVQHRTLNKEWSVTLCACFCIEFWNGCCLRADVKCFSRDLCQFKLCTSIVSFFDYLPASPKWKTSCV